VTKNYLNLEVSYAFRCLKGKHDTSYQSLYLISYYKINIVTIIKLYKTVCTTISKMKIENDLLFAYDCNKLAINTCCFSSHFTLSAQTRHA